MKINGINHNKNSTKKIKRTTRQLLTNKSLFKYQEESRRKRKKFHSAVAYDGKQNCSSA